MLFITLLATASAACRQLTCEDIKNDQKCGAVETCAWSQTRNSCFTMKANVDCSKLESDDCFKYRDVCDWDYDTKVCKVLIKKQGCSSFKTYEDCKSSRSYNKGGNSCDWQHSKCVDVETCQQTQNVYMCRNNYLLYDRCYTVIRGQQYEQHYRHDQTILEVFDDVKCVSQDCFNRRYTCESTIGFTNGRRCFESPIGGCNNCQNFLSPNSCVETKNCYWGDNKCLDIKCTDLKSQATCLAQKYCNWNNINTSCEYVKPEFAHCFSRAKDFQASGQDQNIKSDL